MAGLPGDPAAPFRFALPLMTHAVENERLFRALVGRQSGQQVQWQFRDVVVSVLAGELAAMGLPPEGQGETVRFLAGGFLELLTALLDAARPGDVGSGRPASPDLQLAAVHAATFRRLALRVVGAV